MLINRTRNPHTIRGYCVNLGCESFSRLPGSGSEEVFRFDILCHPGFFKMKAILKFDLSDPDDRNDHKIAVHANDMALILWELLYNSRKGFEQEMDEKHLDGDGVLDLVYIRLSDLLYEHSININDLVQ